MSILTGEKISSVNNQIFKEGFDASCIEPASYSMRIGDSFVAVYGQQYKSDRNPFPYEQFGGTLILPARRITVLTTIEVIDLGEGFVGKVGISYTWSSKGIIPLFGPQIEPGYKGVFFAILYNATNKDIRIDRGAKMLKLEIHELEGSRTTNSQGITQVDFSELTKEDLLGDLQGFVTQLKTDIQENKNQIDSIKDKVSSVEKLTAEVGAGYRQLVFFGVFLISASIFGVIFTILLSTTNYQKLISLIGPNIMVFIVILLIAIFVGGWVFTLYVVNRNLRSKTI